METWKEYRFNEIMKIKHGYAFEGTSFSDEPTKWSLLTPANFTLSGGFQETNRYYKEDGDPFPSEFILSKDDLIVTMTDLSKEIDTIGYGALVPSDNKYLHNQRIGLVTITNPEIDKHYLYWLMRTKFYQRFVAGSSNGATVHHTSPDRIMKFKWNFPPLPIQQKIASILSTYDNLIQNYKMQIEGLQSCASELYKEWFVRFRFPGYQTTQFENGIPVGWNVARVGEYVKIKSGYAFKSEWWQEEGCPVVKIKDIDNGEIDINHFDYVSEEHVLKAKSFLLQEGDLVIAMTGATIGKIGLVPKIENLFTNQRVGKFFIGNNPFEKMPFLYCLFSQNSTTETILCLSGASSAQPNISPDQLESIKFFYNEEIVRQFNKTAEPLFRKILSLRQQIINLTQQRDLLLPRLMSGKLEVN